MWGVKGRYDEPKNEKAPDLDDLNDYNRNLYRDEVAGLIERFNSALSAGEPKLYAPTSSSIAPSENGRDRNSTPRPANRSTTALTKST